MRVQIILTTNQGEIMKTVLLMLATTLLAQAAFAADLYCGASVEKIPGSQAFNKLLFWEKTDVTKPQIRFLMADGSVLKADGQSTSQVDKVVDGSLALIISSVENRPQLSLAYVKRDEKNQIGFTAMAIANSSKDSNIMLMANGAVLICREM